MANIKITDLTAYTDPLSTDVLPIVDVTSDTTKKVSIADLLKNASAGTAAAPGIAFDGDSNTGIYSPGADQVAISTGGAGRLFVDASGRLYLGTTAAGSTSADDFTIGGSGARGITIRSGISSAGGIHFSDGTSGNSQFKGIIAYDHGGDYMRFYTNAQERLRIDSSGRLLVGTSSSVAAGSTVEATLQVNQGSGVAAAFYSTANTAGPGGLLVLGHGRGSTSGLLSANDTIGDIRFAAGDGTDLITQAARIYAEVDGTPGANDMPGRLVFSTTADGASSPTARMTIKNDGRVGIGTASPGAKLHISDGSSASALIDPGSSTVTYKTRNANNTGYTSAIHDATQHITRVAGIEACRVDTSRRLLVGTSSTSASANTVLQGHSANSVQDGKLYIQRGATSLGDNTRTGQINFADSASNIGAAIESWSDDTWASGDYPGRLVFSTTADGASSPTERMRIKNDGTINFSNVAVYADNAAAKTGGLVDGDVYRTSTGDLKIVYT